MNDTHTQPKWPSKTVTLRGRYVTLVALNHGHVDDLWAMVSRPEVRVSPMWDYLQEEPPTEYASFSRTVEHRINHEHGVWYAILDVKNSKAIGWNCLYGLSKNSSDLQDMRPGTGIFLPSPDVQKTPRATEAMFLLLTYAFQDLEIGKLLWETDVLNTPSRRAAVRLGFEFDSLEEGEAVWKGKSSDMVRYRVKNSDWSVVKIAMERWLDVANFGKTGEQRRRLEDIRKDVGEE